MLFVIEKLLQKAYFYLQKNEKKDRIIGILKRIVRNRKKEKRMDQTFGVKQNNIIYYVRKGAYLVVEKNKKFATVKIPKGTFLIGGGIEEGESFTECIKREVMEEIGYTVKIKEYLGCTESYREHEKWKNLHAIQYYYSGDLIEKVCEPIEKDHELQWNTFEEVRNMIYLEQQRWAIEEYQARRTE